MQIRWALLALILLGCDRPTVNGQPVAVGRTEQSCEDYAAATQLTDYVNPNTGKLDRDPQTGEIVEPATGRVALTKAQEDCVKREAQKAIDAYEGT